MRNKGIIIDLDGTLSDSSHRKHYVERPKGEKKDFDSFYKKCGGDPVHKWCLEILNRFKRDHDIWLVSGRPEAYRGITLTWLGEHGVFKGDYIDLLMRKDGNYEQDYLLKKRIYEKQIAPHSDIIFCVDDRKQVVDMWRSLGLVCLQCADGDF